MSEEKIPTVKADKDGIVKCPYCERTHRHGGRGNGIAFGQRLAECFRGEYIVIPFDAEINWGKLRLPAEEAENIIKTYGKSAHLFSSAEGIKHVAIIFCQEMIAISSLSREHHPFKQYWEKVQEEVVKLPIDAFPPVFAPVYGGKSVPMPATPLELKCYECKHIGAPEIRHVFSPYKETMRQLHKSNNCTKCGYEIMSTTNVFRDSESEDYVKKKLTEEGIVFEYLLSIGTRIIFLKDLESDASGDSPAFVYAREGDGGIVSGHDCKEGHWVKWDNWTTPFGAKYGIDFVEDKYHNKDG